jgi:hypothetical protein
MARRVRLPELLLACAAVLLFALVVTGVELLLRAVDPQYLGRVRGPSVFSEDYGWAWRPGFEGPLQGVWTTIDARGCRGRGNELRKGPGRVRVVVLGDSIAFGTRVRDEETFSALLERRRPELEVVNMAVEGYSTDQELLRLQKEGLLYKPDLVVLSVCVANDPRGNADPGIYDTPKPWFTLDGDALVLHDAHLRRSPAVRLRQWLEDHSHLYNRLRGTTPTDLAGEAREKGGVPPVARLSRSEGNALTVRLVGAIHDAATGAGARLLVILHPDRASFEGRSPVLSRLRRALEPQGIEVVDPGEIFRAAGLGYDLVSLDDHGHLTPLGHHVVAEALEGRLGK